MNSPAVSVNERIQNFSLHIPCAAFQLMDTLAGQTNQRTNGPVNAHLRPEIYTNKLV